MNSLQKDINEWLDMKLKMTQIEINLFKNIINLKFSDFTKEIENEGKKGMEGGKGMEGKKGMEGGKVDNIDNIIKNLLKENNDIKKIFEKLLKLNYDYNLIKIKLGIDYEECVNRLLENPNDIEIIK
jgi:hypothetical protein